jgi:hypothetical protein
MRFPRAAIRLSIATAFAIGTAMCSSAAPSFGVATPNELLDYHDTSTAPAYCRTPQTLLEQAAGEFRKLAPNASADVVADTLGSKILRIVAPIGADATCKNYYVADVWTERDSGSTTDYRVLVFGWARRVCGSDSYAAPSGIDATRAVTSQLRKVFSTCR